MRERHFDVLALLESPEPFSLPFALQQEWDDAGPEELSEGERNIYLALGYFMEVSHGGHEYWFGTLYADYARETVQALEAIGMNECAAVCRRSFEVWPDGEVPEDFEFRERVILDEWLAEDPEGVMGRLSPLDRESYAARDLEDDHEHFYRYIATSPADFGINPAKVPDPAEVIRRLREAEAREREKQREKQRKKDEEEAKNPPKPEKPLPESDTFRTGARRVLVFLVPAVLLMSAAVFVPGERLALYRAIAIVIGLVLLRSALLRLLFRVRMIPKGILISGEPGIPWTAITGCQLLSVNQYVPGRGFMIEYQLPEGGIGHAFVPRSLARYGQAWKMFLEMTTRHGSPWSFAEGIREIKGILADRSG